MLITAEESEVGHGVGVYGGNEETLLLAICSLWLKFAPQSRPVSQAVHGPLPVDIGLPSSSASLCLMALVTDLETPQ